ncbi:EutP/PduV family microcompartment system protein [Psychromonas hadalis]|uniref:EutP/PduV family microcompartment system protein n=1 Tax=Psychromonas hadalis TaxID=211669 RepID=UPI0003B2FFCD|nr:EutP/PduV family microcompartment system protein [Psychromonas hadalis]
MKKNQLDNIVFVGEVDAGKSALIGKLLTQKTNTGKTQAPIYYDGNIVDTPGEFVDNRAWSGALISTISTVKTIVYLQPANAMRFAPASGILTVYPNKRIIGVISKVDVDNANVEKAIRFLKQNRIPEPYIEVSIYDPASIQMLSKVLST